jgi:hypothetical protein
VKADLGLRGCLHKAAYTNQPCLRRGFEIPVRILLLDWLAYRCRWASRLVEPPPLPLVRHGEVQQRNLRRQRLTEAELQRQLRQQGIESLAEVKLATLSHARTPQCLRPSASPSVQ